MAALLAGCLLCAGALAGNPHGGPPGQTKKPSPPAAPAPVPAPPPAPPGAGTQVVQGVVQSMTPALVVVKQLDGTAVSVPYDKKTNIVVDGKPGKIAEVKRGYILAASWKAGKPAVVLRFVRPS
jgi:hypothetical protein